MKKKKQNNKAFIIVLGLFVAVIVIALVVKTLYVPTKTYHSKFLKITFDYPAKFNLEERFGTVTLKNTKGEIIVSTNGTNYDSIDGYLENLSKLNHFTITNMEKIKLKYEQATVVTIDNKQKDYFFYPTKWSVYFISASSPDLYPDLDQIAKSFRYEP